MKFRSVMIDAGPMREFTNIITTISKLSKECTMRISDDKLYFIVNEDTCASSTPSLWCEIPQARFFSEYQMVGLDEEYRDIYLGINSINLAKSLANLKSAVKLKMKLTNKQCPCLTLETEVTPLASSDTRQIIHDIPVTVIPRKMWSNFHEPVVPQLDISIELPALKLLKTTIDRMKSMSSEIVIRASAEGKLTLQIHTDKAKVSTRFKELRVESFQGPIDHSDSEPEIQSVDDMSRVCHCKVEAKKFSMFLSADQIGQNQNICSLVHKKLVILCFQTKENVKLQCFITGIVY